MTQDKDDTEALLDRIVEGQQSPIELLLDRHRGRLAAMVRLRMDRRLAARFDPSDVVQDALTEAYRKLPEYAKRRPMPFYPWLRSIAWERLIQLHRHHVKANRRSINNEEHCFALADGSEAAMAEHFVQSAATASGHAVQREMCLRVRTAIDELPEAAREVVVLRHLEDMSFKEICAVLGVSEQAVYSRYRRAVERLNRALQSEA